MPFVSHGRQVQCNLNQNNNVFQCNAFEHFENAICKFHTFHPGVDFNDNFAHTMRTQREWNIYIIQLVIIRSQPSFAQAIAAISFWMRTN